VVLKAAKLLENTPAIHFVLLGDGKEKPYCKKTQKKCA
jgi:glutamate racemase